MRTILAAAAAPLGEVHEQECEIVKQISRCDQVTELHRVEQHGPALQQHDVAKMQIAMNPRDETPPPAFYQKGVDARIFGSACARKRFDLMRWKEIRFFAERLHMLVDVVGERLDPAARIDRRCVRMRLSDSAAKSIGEACVNFARLRQVVEGRVLVEAMHLDRPFDRRPIPAQLEPAAGGARDRHHALVDLRRERPVKPQLRFASLSALVESGIVQEGKGHRPLDLESARTCQKK